jgi:hypothetical protein
MAVVEGLRATPGDAPSELRDRPVPGVLERTLEQPRGVEDVRLDELPDVRISLREGFHDRSMLLEVEGVELVELHARRPDGLAVEDAPRVLRGFGQLGDAGGVEVDVVELSIRVHPLGGERLPAGAGWSLAELASEPREPLFGALEPAEIRRRQPVARELCGEALEGGAHHERLEELCTGQRPDLDTALAGERDEPERRELTERLTNRRTADAELLGELLLPKQIAGWELPREDRVLEDARDLVGLGRGV